MLAFRILLALSTLAIAAAQTSVVSLFLLDAPEPLSGSVVATVSSLSKDKYRTSLTICIRVQKSDTTTYSITCAPRGTAHDECSSFGLVYTAAPTRVEWGLASPYNRFVSQKASVDYVLLSFFFPSNELTIDSHGKWLCSMSSSTSTTALCTFLLPSTGSTTEYGMTATISGRTLPSKAVTITAGPSTTATGATATVDASTSGAASASTGGLPQITAGPGFVLGGVAAALVAAAL